MTKCTYRLIVKTDYLAASEEFGKRGEAWEEGVAATVLIDLRPARGPFFADRAFRGVLPEIQCGEPRDTHT
jgi:hypothetical protein